MVRARTAARSDRYLFFFQAEDGIRDIGVTGVQTCALPISRSSAAGRGPAGRARSGTTAAAPARSRSEERRVGKESGWPGWSHHRKKEWDEERGAIGLMRGRTD